MITPYGPEAIDWGVPVVFVIGEMEKWLIIN